MSPIAASEIYNRKVRNQRLSLEEFRDKAVVLKSRPSKILLELTQNCNFKCKMCPQSFVPKYQRYSSALNMPMQLFEKVASSLFDDAYFVDLRGFGETVILPYWPELVDGLDAHPLINWHLVTNLSLPRDATWEKMIKNGFILGFSCDAGTKETFERIRVRSHFDKIVHNLGVVSDSIKKYKKGFIYFIVTVQKMNIAELPQILELARRFSVKEVQFKIVQRNPGHEEHLSDSDRPVLLASVQRSLELAIDYGIRLTINDREMLDGLDAEKVRRADAISFPSPGLNFPPTESASAWAEVDQDVLGRSKVSLHKQCFKPFHYVYVSYDGRVGPCNHMMEPHMKDMGDLKTQSFEEIWNGQPYQFFRGELLYNRPMDPRCRWCFEHRLED